MKVNNNEKLEEIDIYLEQIKRYKLLTREREYELSERIKKGDEQALDELVNANLRFVVSIAKAYKKSGIPFHDLISEGNIGLVKAASKFDHTKGVKFISYAVWWVKSQIQESIKENAKSDNFHGDDYMEMMMRDSDFEYKTNLINEDFENDVVTMSSRQTVIDELTKVLNEREKKILLMYYGVGRKSECTLEEIGSELNLTKERVRQIKDKALTKVKINALISDEFDSFSESR